MTKRKILAISIALILGVSLGACSSANESKEKKAVYPNRITKPKEGKGEYTDLITESEGGTYFFFYSNSPKEYVDFLESLDKDKYEIVDITVQGFTYKNEDCYMITYKKKNVETP